MYSSDPINSKASKRQSNIELLRIFAALGVIMLHYNYYYGFKSIELNTPNYYILLTLESINICAVDLFVLISGYFMCKKISIDFRKIIYLLAEVSLARISFYVAGVITGNAFNIRTFIANAIPINYYAILYCVVFLISPYLNKLICSLNMRALARLNMILIVLFSLLPTIIDTAQFLTGSDLGGLSTIGIKGSNYGYTAINFILMYIVGASIRRQNELRKPIQNKILICALVIIIPMLCVLGNIALTKIDDLNFAYGYCNPLIILSAIIIFEIFCNINMKYNKVINTVAKGTFTVFLTHGWLLPYCKIEEIVNRNSIILIGHILLTVVSIYAIGLAIDSLYRAIWLHLIENHILTKKMEISAE